MGTCVLRVRETSKWRPHKDLSTRAEHRGGLARISGEAVERQWSEGAELSVFMN